MTEPLSATILNVNDEPTRSALSRLLRHAGFTVQEAATGAEALRRAADQPDLILLGVHLADTDGFEVCRRLKADPATAPIPVLHLSACFAKWQDRVQGPEGGA